MNTFRKYHKLSKNELRSINGGKAECIEFESCRFGYCCQNYTCQPCYP